MRVKRVALGSTNCANPGSEPCYVDWSDRRVLGFIVVRRTTDLAKIRSTSASVVGTGVDPVTSRFSGARSAN